MTLSVLIVDDEAPARRRLRDLLGDIAAKVPHIVAGEAASGAIAVAMVADLAPDLVLADMQMPNMTGIELAQHLGRLENPPAIIFVTAHDEFAVRAFEVNALDYLMKPVRAERLSAALTKAAAVRKPPSLEALERSSPEARRHLSIAERGRLTLVPVADIIYLRAELKYITVRTEAREFLLEESLTRLEEEFADRFVRVHRSALIARDCIAGFERVPAGKDAEGEGGAQWQVVLRGVSERVPVSRRLWAGVKGLVRER